MVLINSAISSKFSITVTVNNGITDYGDSAIAVDCGDSALI